MRCSLLLAAACCGLSVNLTAQRFFNGKREVGAFLGVSNYHGDLAPSLVVSDFRPAIGALFRYNFNPYVAYRVQGSFAEIRGSDANYAAQRPRNLEFRSVIIEAANTMEFNFRRFGTNVLDQDFSPFLTIGLNLFYFDPIGRFGDNEHHLRRHHTEGQKRAYSPLQVAVPIGIGIKQNLSRNWVLGVEGVWRKTFTDYLDDVSGFYPDYKAHADKYGSLSADLSHRQTLNGDKPFKAGTQRGDKHLRDWYFFLGMTLTYRFTPVICRG